MSEPTAKTTTLAISRMVKSTPLLPKPANFFGWTRLGEVYYLECSHFEPFEYSQVVVNAGLTDSQSPDSPEATLKVYPTDQFILSARDAIQLYNTATSILNDMKENGIIQSEQIEALSTTSSQSPPEEV